MKHPTDKYIFSLGILFEIRNTKNDSTGSSPFELMYGRKPLRPNGFDFQPVPGEQGAHEIIDVPIKKTLQSLERVRQVLYKNSCPGSKQVQSMQKGNFERSKGTPTIYFSSDVRKNLKRHHTF